MGNVFATTTEIKKDDEMTFESTFPTDILIEILSFVPAKDLLNNCSLVCHEWCSLINGHGIWKRKCVRENKVIPPWIFDNIPLNYYRKLYLGNPFGRNLLKNSCGEDQFKFYEIIQGGDGWAVENPPNGADAVPAEVGSQSCFVTSYYECSSRQLIYLIEEGIAEEVLDNIKPEILVGEWYATRFDCGAIYNLNILLLSEGNSILDSFSFKHEEPQWTGRAWSLVSHAFKDYPAGVRMISFEHSGKDTQFWAGNYGSKMTGGFVKFKLK